MRTIRNAALVAALLSSVCAFASPSDARASRTHHHPPSPLTTAVRECITQTLADAKLANAKFNARRIRIGDTVRICGNERVFARGDTIRRWAYWIKKTELQSPSTSGSVTADLARANEVIKTQQAVISADTKKFLVYEKTIRSDGRVIAALRQELKIAKKVPAFLVRNWDWMLLAILLLGACVGIELGRRRLSALTQERNALNRALSTQSTRHEAALAEARKKERAPPSTIAPADQSTEQHELRGRLSTLEHTLESAAGVVTQLPLADEKMRFLFRPASAEHGGKEEWFGFDIQTQPHKSHFVHGEPVTDLMGMAGWHRNGNEALIYGRYNQRTGALVWLKENFLEQIKWSEGARRWLAEHEHVTIVSSENISLKDWVETTSFKIERGISEVREAAA